MMRKSLFLLATVVLSSMILSCSSEDSDGNSKSITLRNHTESGCKDYDSSSGKQKVKMLVVERISLKGNKKGMLSIFHENAVFTCEADFTITADASENTIVVNEDAPPSTNCICHYDLNSEVGPLENKTYTLIVKNNNAIICTHQFHYSSTLDESFDVMKKE